MTSSGDECCYKGKYRGAQWRYKTFVIFVTHKVSQVQTIPMINDLAVALLRCDDNDDQ